jgi:signal transduction histidine kinase
LGFRLALASALCIALLALGAVGVLSYRRAVQENEDEQWVGHTHEVLERLSAIRIDLIDAETGERGFALTGEQPYLEPYESALRRLELDIGELRTLTHDNAVQQASIVQIEPLITARLAELRRGIDTRRQKGLQAGIELIRESNGKETMDAIRRVIDAMDREERGLLAQRLEQVRFSAGRTKILIVLGNAVGLLFLCVAGFAIYREMDKRHKAERELCQSNARTEAANKELQAFSYSVSHDLRAPLRGIDGFSLALLEDCGEALNEDGRDYLLRIRKATARMGKLIDNLLELARMTRTEMLTEEVNLSGLAEEVAAQCRAADPQRKAVFVITPDLILHGDRILMRALLENLLGNAWKFTSKRMDACIELGADRNNGKSVFFVKDNGAGFDMRYADKLFGVFQRLHDVNEFPGTGVGLATVQRIVIRHGGRVWADSKPGEGATFYFQVGS